MLCVAATPPATAQEQPSLPTEAVAQVGEVVIPQTEFNRWISIAFQSGYGPGDVFSPSRFEMCATQGLGQPRASNSKPEPQWLKKRCKRFRIQTALSQAMTFLIRAQWVEQEAAALGIVVTDAQTRRAFERQRRVTFPKLRAYRRFLRLSGHRERDVLYRVRVDLLRARLVRQTMGSPPVSDEDVSRYHARHRARYRELPRNRARRSIRKLLIRQQERRALPRFISDLRLRYRAITTCGESYAVPDCGMTVKLPAPSP
jgi:hypothetical protein